MNFDRPVLGRKSVAMLALGIGSLGLSSASRAALVMDISVNGGAPIVVADNGPLDSNPAPNAITYNSTLSGFAISLLTSDTNNPGNATSGFIANNESVFQNISGAPITAVVTLNDSGFTAPTVPPLALLSDFSATLVSPGPGDFASLASTANTTSSPTQTLTASGSATEAVPFTDAGTYSLQSVTTLRLSPGASAALNSTTSVTPNVTPEPASIGLLGLGAFGLLVRRRRN